MVPMAMRCGVVRSFSKLTKYGFLGEPGVDGDIFVHLYAVAGRRPLRAGQRVQFELQTTDKGFRAQNVTVLR